MPDEKQKRIDEALDAYDAHTERVQREGGTRRGMTRAYGEKWKQASDERKARRAQEVSDASH